MGKFNAEKGSVLWTLWADLFLLWREHGDCKTKDDFDEWYKAVRNLDDKYAKTEEKDLCREILITMGEVIDKRYLARHDKQEGV